MSEKSHPKGCPLEETRKRKLNIIVKIFVINIMMRCVYTNQERFGYQPLIQ